MTQLDRTQQRILGVLMEKELAVPESYPLTENALLAGCNQKSNRDPEMGLEPFEVHGALVALMADDWAKTVSSVGNRTARYAHRFESRYPVDQKEKAVLCELLVRGPQAPGALKPRVARLGFSSTPSEIEEVLASLASRAVPMVERLEKRPRERDRRWRHCLGEMDESHQGESVAAAPRDPAPEPAPQRLAGGDLEQRVAQLEAVVEELRAELRGLK